MVWEEGNLPRQHPFITACGTLNVLGIPIVRRLMIDLWGIMVYHSKIHQIDEFPMFAIGLIHRSNRDPKRRWSETFSFAGHRPKPEFPLIV